MTTTLLDRITAAIDEAERDARRCEEVFPCDWELSDRGWMAHVTANGPHFPTVVTLDQNQVAEDFGYLADALRHFVRQNPKATLIRCAAHKRLIADYRAYADAYDYRSSDPVRPEPLLPLWLAVLRVAEGYGLDVQED